MKLIFNIFVLLATAFAWSQSTVNPNTGNAYLLFGPNSSWGQYFQVGGNGRVTPNAGIFATNGNLHLDSKDGAFSTYVNYYSKGNTILNGQGGNVGIGTTGPGAKLEVKSSNGLRTLLNMNEQSAISFLPNNGNSYFHISHGLNNDLVISQGGIVGGGNLMVIKNMGNIGIGTNSPDSKLTVKGKIHVEEVKVDLSVPGPDYVFKDDYELRSLEEIQKFIKENGHLPNIPSAKEMEENGVELGVMNMKLLEKIEELTLYIISLEKKQEEFALQKELDRKTIDDLKETLHKRLKKIETKLNLN
ncbi:tail fiber protein [Sediminicola sp. YIK13]|uniref:tail fiber protein n=1 Tax=Sediminicola sp. YIK13 TaxID=1453352 RepID=UPI000780A979|nr:tail fiber protein [Sediminicola sp. YIK13]